jgi:hypothetical protein
MHIYDYIRKHTTLPCTYKRIIDEQNLFVHKRRERERERERHTHALVILCVKIQYIM